LFERHEILKSPTFIIPLLVEYKNVLWSVGWNEELVISSDNSSISYGSISTMLNAFLGYSKFHKFIFSSSLLIKCSQSDDYEIEFILNLCKFGNLCFN